MKKSVENVMSELDLDGKLPVIIVTRENSKPQKKHQQEENLTVRQMEIFIEQELDMLKKIKVQSDAHTRMILGLFGFLVLFMMFILISFPK